MLGKKKLKILFSNPLSSLLSPYTVIFFTLLFSIFQSALYLSNYNMALAIPNTFSLGSNVTSSLGAAGSTIRIDKSLYGLGDIIEVLGTVINPVAGKNVLLDAYTPDGAPVFSFLTAEDVSNVVLRPAANNGSFSYRFDTSGVDEGEYTVVATYEGDSTIIKFSIQNMTKVAANTSDITSIKPTKGIPYTPSDEVELVGTVTNPAIGKNVRMDLYGPDGTAILPISYEYLDTIAEVKPDINNGSFSFRYPLNNSPEGEYTVVATYEGDSTIIKFNVETI
jgi:hypothetical protein